MFLRSPNFLQTESAHVQLLEILPPGPLYLVVGLTLGLLLHPLLPPLAPMDTPRPLHWLQGNTRAGGGSIQGYTEAREGSIQGYTRAGQSETIEHGET